jgi:hypothetical protein
VRACRSGEIHFLRHSVNLFRFKDWGKSEVGNQGDHMDKKEQDSGENFKVTGVIGGGK